MIGNLENFMNLAIDEARRAGARGEVPVGAIIVCGEKVIARAHNEVEVNSDATQHAEILAIQRASAIQKSWRLDGCRLFVTLEPCPMCMGAIIASRISEVFFGADDPQRGAAGSLLNLAELPSPSPQPKIVSGLLLDEAKKLLDDFFQSARSR